MGQTGLKSEQIQDEQIKSQDLNITETGHAVITKVVAGTGVTISSTGIDAGTGAVTINATQPEGATGSFTTSDSKTVTVVNGIITSII